MTKRDYDAILLDLDGTLLDEGDRIHPRTLAALRAASAAGVRVMVATGRSELATLPVLEQLGIDHPAVVFNGAGVWCPSARRLIEERVLSERTLARAVRFGVDGGYMTVAMCSGVKYATAPRDEAELGALKDMKGLVTVSADALLDRRAMRVTFFSSRHASSDEFAAQIEAAIAAPIYTTHFPLACLPHHRSSRMLVADIHPPCKGKAEALRWLAEEHGIAAERVVAVGDAGNDVPMMRAAGLGVAMGNAYPDAMAVADRVIGANDTDAIGRLVEELFLSGRPAAVNSDAAN
jgi:Cof subfamily protein (haloacid dehalogenase superfamily)